MIFLLLVLAFGALLVLVFTLAISWQQERERAIRAEIVSMHRPGDAAARFERIEQALEGIALEVERLAEAQRFSARILAEGKPQLLAREASTRERQDPEAG
ncbi:MAG: hypothetical protein WD825_04405 [Gemmatimonadaceae bacterium]